MARLGPNIRSVAPVSMRKRVRSFWTDVFKCDHISPRDDLDVFLFADGSRIGVFFVADDEALTNERHRVAGTWIEVLVDDAASTRAALTKQGLEPMQYFDKEHQYFQAPGGQVFRLGQ
jgi:hypothetical protein